MTRTAALLVPLVLLVTATTCLALPQLGNPAVDIPWVNGPCIGKLGQYAAVRVPEGFTFTDSAGARLFLEATQNPSSGDEMGIIVNAEQGWFVVFEYNAVGYVKDDEKDDLDADAILDGIRKGNDRANQEREKRGWSPVLVEGWQQRPFYDVTTHNLVWAIRGQSEGSVVVNHSTRLLGREGVMNVDLVLKPEQLGQAVPQLAAIIDGFSFNPGRRYAEWRAGDKVASYGLTALIGGGVGAAAIKSGLLGKLWKVLVVGVVGLLAALRKIVGALFGRSKPPESHEYR